MNEVVLVTGCAGFIGSNLVDRLLKEKYKVVGIDNFNDYYDPKIKENNIALAKKNENFFLFEGDILDQIFLEKIFNKYKIDIIVHLAARAGVRPSIKDPYYYAEVNKIGTLNLLELSVKKKVKRFIFASSSSVYGATDKIPFEENDKTISIISPYGASKKAAEYFVEAFYKLYGIKSVLLRFFTVYGPRGRPDMAPYIFVNSILKDKYIEQFGAGSIRDFTYIDDIIDGILASIKTDVNFETINLGNNNPTEISDFIKIIENISGKKAIIKIGKKRIGDVDKTWASIDKAKTLLGWQPKIKIEEGLKRYIEWMKN